MKNTTFVKQLTLKQLNIMKVTKLNTGIITVQKGNTVKVYTEKEYKNRSFLRRVSETLKVWGKAAGEAIRHQ